MKNLKLFSISIIFSSLLVACGGAEKSASTGGGNGGGGNPNPIIAPSTNSDSLIIDNGRGLVNNQDTEKPSN